MAASAVTDHGSPARHPRPSGRRAWITSSAPRWRAADRLGALTYGTTQVVLLFWWVAFYPGTLSYDSIAYVWQATTGNWSTQHSVPYNGLIWLSLRSSGQVALVTLAQTVAMAAGLAYAVTGLRRVGGRGRWLGLAALAATCLPAVGTFTVYLSKDVPFVICQVWLLGTVARIIATRPAPATRLFGAVFAEFAVMALVRQNAFVVIALTTAGLALVLRGLRGRIAAAGAGAIGVGLLANVALFPALGVRPAGSELVLGPAYADIAVAYAEAPDRFSASERALLTEVAPLSYWSGTANCYNADATITYGAAEFDMLAARAHQAELFGLWQRLFKRMPDVIIQARLCRGSIAWNPFPAPAAGRTVKIPIAGVAQLYDFPPERLAQSPFAGAIRSAPPSELVHSVAVFARRVSDTRSFEWIAWRGATWAYLAYLAVILLARRRHDLALLGLAAVVPAGQLNVALNNPSQLARYLMGPLVLGILLAPLAFAGVGARARAEPAGAGPAAHPDGSAPAHPGGAAQAHPAGTARAQNRGMPPN